MRTAILFLCLLAATAQAQFSIPFGFLGTNGGAGGASGPRVYLLKENFDGTGYENSGWDLTVPAPDPDYTTSPAPLEGSQSLHINAGGVDSLVAGHSITSSSEIWHYFLINVHSFSGGPPLVRFVNGGSGGSVKVDLYLNASRALMIHENDGGHDATTSAVISLDTTYGVLVHIKAGSGANQQLSVEFSTTSTFTGSGTAFAGLSNGSGTANIDYVKEGSNTAPTYDLIIDKLRVDNVTIGSSPE